MISASRSTFSLNNLNILRPKVTKNLMNLHKKFCESHPGLIKLIKLMSKWRNDPK